MFDQEQGESSLGEETDLLDVSRILEECADSDISELSQRVITDLDTEIHRLLREESISSEEETESRLSQASVSSIVFEQDEEPASTPQSSSSKHPQSSALYILYGPETESNSSSTESEDELSADLLKVAIHSGPLGAGTDNIAINTGTNIELQCQGSDDDSQDEFEDSCSTECFPRPLADELEEATSKGTAPMSNQELDLNALATSASSASDENSSSGIDSEEDQLLTTLTSNLHTLSTPKQQTACTPHADDSVGKVSPRQLTLDMLATTDTEELSNVTSESDGEILPVSAMVVYTTQEATKLSVTVQGAVRERMVPMNQLSFEMLATTDSEIDSDLSQSEEELPFQKSEGYREKSLNRTLIRTSELTQLGAVHSDAPMEITLEMLAMPDSDSGAVSESEDDERHTAPSNLSELCTEVVAVSQEMNLKANAEHYNVGLNTSNDGGGMAQDRHMQPLEEISESNEGENSQLPPFQTEEIENENLTPFSFESKSNASGSVKHAKEDIDGIDVECQLGGTDTVYGSNSVVVPQPLSCSHSLPSKFHPTSTSNAQVDEDLQQGHNPGIPELLRKIALLEKQQNKMERAFHEERASLWNIIDRQTQLIQGLHTARLTERKRIQHYHRSVHQKLEVVEGGVVRVGRECAELQSRLTTIETMRSSVERRRAAVEDGSETNSHRGRSISLLSEQKVTKLKKFFGDNPPVLGLFLKRLGYEQYYPRFLNERIGLLELPHITEEQLITLGIPMGPRLRIMHEAQLL